jgi:hypothetical protein
VPILVLVGKHVIGHAGLGDNMLLREMFSPVGGPKEDQSDIDWADDLKFYIDNDEKLLGRFIFPAVERHEKYAGNPNAYKIYVKPIKSCLESYLNKFEVEDPDKKFTDDLIESLAKKIATQQENFFKKGDYKKDKRKIS